MSRVSGLLRRPLVIGVLTASVLVAAVGAVWFQPWKLWVDETVEEALPTASAKGSAPPEESPSAQPSVPAEPVTVAGGELVSHEHTTTGTVAVLKLADGSRVLRIEDLETSNGPDLRVWITDAPVKEGTAGWHVFDDGAHVSLGRLKGNKGSQNYPLPEGVDLGEYTSVSIWCDRFDVSFGAAELTTPAQT